jgi:hypothetical protein
MVLSAGLYMYRLSVIRNSQHLTDGVSRCLNVNTSSKKKHIKRKLNVGVADAVCELRRTAYNKTYIKVIR